MNRTDLMSYHRKAVRVAQRWESATPGTQTKRKAFEAYEKAEQRFLDALNAIELVSD